MRITSFSLRKSRLVLFLSLLLVFTFFATNSMWAKGLGHPIAGLQGRQKPAGSPVGGIVTAVKGSNIEILGGAITIDASSAKVFTPGNQPGKATQSDLSALKPGMNIMAFIDETVSASSLVAKEIMLPPTSHARLGGTLQSIDTASGVISILNQKIFITTETKFFSDEITSLSDLQIGQHIFVAVENLNGRLTAIGIGHQPDHPAGARPDGFGRPMRP